MKEIAFKIYKALKEEKLENILPLKEKLPLKQTKKLKLIEITQLNKIAKELAKLIENENWWYDKLKEFWQKGKREEKILIISSLEYLTKKNHSKVKEFIISILQDINDWEICDQLALKPLAKLAIQNQKEIFNLLFQWINQDNKWLRRLAIATIPPFIRAKPQEALICLDLISKSLKEKDIDVKKAVAWALREISKKDKSVVFEFLNKYKQINDKNTKWIIKEGAKKLSPLQQKILK